MVEAILIAGPTASGKTKLAIDLAREHRAAIVNADSMQVYADLRIITARPGPEEENRAPHHLFGHVDGAVRYSTGQWLRDVAALLPRLGRPVIFVGGTGLYFQALLGGLSPVPPVPGEVVRAVERRLAREGLAALQDELRFKDPELVASLPALDAQRLVRALSVHQATGRPLSAWRKQAAPPLVNPDAARRLVVLPGREVLYERINARVGKMLQDGALEEVRRLLARGLSPALPVMKAIGVAELGAHLDGKIGLEEARDQMAMHTRRYAKRQMTWIRNRMAEWERVVP